MIAIAPSFTTKEYKWTGWKAIRASKSFIHQHDEDAEHYLVYGYDGPEVHVCRIYRGEVPVVVVENGYTQEQNDLDKADFEANYKSTSNKSLIPRDSDGSPIQRYKATFSGWQYRMHGIEFETCVKDSNQEFDDTAASFGFTTVKFYNDANVQLTEQADIESAETGAVKTVLDWEPTHDVEILGGQCKQVAISTEDVRIWVRAVPDVPAMFGGNKLFISMANLKFLGAGDAVVADGRAAKLLKYDATFHTNKIRIIIRHPKGFKHKIAFWLEFFRP